MSSTIIRKCKSHLKFYIDVSNAIIDVQLHDGMGS